MRLLQLRNNKFWQVTHIIRLWNIYPQAFEEANEWLSDLTYGVDEIDSISEFSKADVMSMPHVTIDIYFGDLMVYKDFKAIFDEMVIQIPLSINKHEQF